MQVLSILHQTLASLLKVKHQRTCTLFCKGWALLNKTMRACGKQCRNCKNRCKGCKCS